MTLVIGRDEELDWLREKMDSGRPAGLIGGAGLGKPALLNSAVEASGRAFH